MNSLVDEDTLSLRERKILYLKDFFIERGGEWAASVLNTVTQAYNEKGHAEWQKLAWREGYHDELDEEWADLDSETDNLTEDDFKKTWILDHAKDWFGDQCGESINEISFRELDLELFAEDLVRAAEENSAYRKILDIWRAGYKGSGYICTHADDNSLLTYTEVSLFWYIVNQYLEEHEYYELVDKGGESFFEEL